MLLHLPARAFRLVPAVVLAACALAACGGGQEVSVRADPTTTSAAPVTSTTEAPPAGSQFVRFGGLRFTVPADWPVHDLAADPTTCVRTDEHAAFLGEPGPEPDCPARIVGHTETLQVALLDDRRQVDATRATQATTINGLSARVDPEPDINGALTAVFTDQNLLVIITFGDDRPLADAILASVAASP